MSKAKLFKKISVTGAHSSVGKTSLASVILNSIAGFGAIKFTRTSLYLSVTDDPGEILQKSKDTAILSESGAEHVVWVQSPAENLKDALDVAVNKLSHLRGIVVEGNSPVDYLDPDLVIFVIGEDGQIKPSAESVSRRADVVVINTDKDPYNLPFLNRLRQEKSKIFQIDLMHKSGEIDKFITYVKKYITQV
jgi:molybdopterin-guanine dinucleotide biosynthesis protein